jgi:hypothetical protein
MLSVSPDVEILDTYSNTRCCFVWGLGISKGLPRGSAFEVQDGSPSQLQYHIPSQLGAPGGGISTGLDTQRS